MKKLIVLTAVFCLCFQATAVLAATPDYSGEWTLDVSKSKLPEQAKVESMMLKVSQSAKKLTVETIVERNADVGRGGIGGGLRRGGGNGGAQSVIYSLDGKDSVTDIGSGIMAGSEARTAKVTADGKLSLTTTRKFTSEMGGSATKSNETWELLDGGKTLKIIRYVETSGGGINSEMYFTKGSAGGTGKTVAVQKENIRSTESEPVNSGIVNGKSKFMPLPDYPEEAKPFRASGAVNVQVTIDENGNVSSAKAVSGSPYLRKSAEQAAMKARFSPKMLEGKPVKVTGIIVYNFVP